MTVCACMRVACVRALIPVVIPPFCTCVSSLTRPMHPTHTCTRAFHAWLSSVPPGVPITISPGEPAPLGYDSVASDWRVGGCVSANARDREATTLLLASRSLLLPPSSLLLASLPPCSFLLAPCSLLLAPCFLRLPLCSVLRASCFVLCASCLLYSCFLLWKQQEHGQGQQEQEQQEERSRKGSKISKSSNKAQVVRTRH